VPRRGYPNDSAHDVAHAGPVGVHGLPGTTFLASASTSVTPVPKVLPARQVGVDSDLACRFCGRFLAGPVPGVMDTTLDMFDQLTSGRADLEGEQVIRLLAEGLRPAQAHVPAAGHHWNLTALSPAIMLRTVLAMTRNGQPHRRPRSRSMLMAHLGFATAGTRHPRHVAWLGSSRRSISSVALLNLGPP